MNILIIDRFPVAFLEQLGRLQVHTHYLPNTDRKEVLSLIPNFDVLVMNSKVKVDKELIDKALRLKLVCRAGVGMDHITVARQPPELAIPERTSARKR